MATIRVEKILREKLNKIPYRELYPFKSHYLKVGKYNMHYVDEGDENAPVVLMVHGNPTWSFYYRNLAKEFIKKGFRVVIPDHIGFGLSDKPQFFEYNLKGHIFNLEKLITSLNLKNIHLVVHEFGGAIGFGAAVNYADRFRSAIILNTQPFNFKKISSDMSFFRKKLSKPLVTGYLNGFTFMATKKGLSSLEKECYLMPYRGQRNRVGINESLQDAIEDKTETTFLALDEIEKQLSKLSFPKLILWGAKDNHLSSDFFTEWKKIYPDAFFKYYHSGGHYILEDEREDVIEQTISFVERYSLEDHELH